MSSKGGMLGSKDGWKMPGTMNYREKAKQAGGEWTVLKEERLTTGQGAPITIKLLETPTKEKRLIALEKATFKGYPQKFVADLELVPQIIAILALLHKEGFQSGEGNESGGVPQTMGGEAEHNPGVVPPRTGEVWEVIEFEGSSNKKIRRDTFSSEKEALEFFNRMKNGNRFAGVGGQWTHYWSYPRRVS